MAYTCWYRWCPLPSSRATFHASVKSSVSSQTSRGLPRRACHSFIEGNIRRGMILCRSPTASVLRRYQRLRSSKRLSDISLVPLGHAKKKHGPGSSLASPGDEDSREIFYGVVDSLHALAISGLGRIGGGLLGIRDWHRTVDTCDLQWRDAAPPFSPTRCVWTPSTGTVLTTPLRRCGIPRCAFVMPVSNLTSRL